MLFLTMTYGSFFQVSFKVGGGRARLGEIVVFLESGGKYIDTVRLSAAQ
jgi:hypothetical protein